MTMEDKVDSSTVTVKDLVFDDENVERQPWEFFGHAAARSQVVFLVQIIIVFVIISVSIANLSFASTCEETTIWVAILSSTVCYMLPAPRPPT